MALTNSQNNTLKADILANSAVAAYVASGQDNAIKDWYNTDSTTLAWKNAFSADDLFDNTQLTEYIARSNAERQAYDMLLSRGRFNPEKASIRRGINDIFSGPTNSTSRGAILTAMTEFATRAEVLFGGNNATTDTVTALKRNWSGKLTDSDIARALRG